MIEEVKRAVDDAMARVAEANTADDVRALEAELLGKRGPFAMFKTGLGALATVDDKRAAGQAVNEATTAVVQRLESRRRELASAEREVQLAAEGLDLTEVMARPQRGHAHVVTQAWERLEDVFIGLGFQVAEGPEVETDWYNFEALNMGEGHPARSDFDTLFVDHAGAPAGTTVLRTHTSPVQIRRMLDG